MTVGTGDTPVLCLRARGVWRCFGTAFVSKRIRLRAKPTFMDVLVMPEGTVKWFNDTKGFGFLHSDDGEDVFVHHSEILTEGYRSLKEGARVEFEGEVTGNIDLKSIGTLEFPVGDEMARLPVSIVRDHSSDQAVSLAFSQSKIEYKRWIVAIGYGNSDNLDWGVESTRDAPGILGGLINFLWLAIRHAGEHLLYLVKISGYFLATGLRSVVIYIERLTRTVGTNEDGRRDEDAIKRV